jgi:hypothetical protein
MGCTSTNLGVVQGGATLSINISYRKPTSYVTFVDPKFTS